MTASEQLRALRIAESANELADVDTDTLELALRGARDRKYRAEQYGYVGNHAAIVAAAAAIVAIENELARRQHADDDARRLEEGDEQRDYAEERANAELLRDELEPDDHSSSRRLDVLAEEAPHLIAPDVLALTLTHAEAELVAAVLDFGGVDNDNLSDDDRDTAARIIGRLRFEPEPPAVDPISPDADVETLTPAELEQLATDHPHTAPAVAAELERRRLADPYDPTPEPERRPEPTTMGGETAHDLAREILADRTASWRYSPNVRNLAALILSADSLEELEQA